MTKETDIVLKVSLLGDIAVGKTSLISRFSKGTFRFDTDTTMFDQVNVRLRVEGDTVKVRVIDNAGIESCLQVMRSCNQRADGLILVYDVTSKRSFDNLDTWLERIKDLCEDNVQIIVVGNKVDLNYYKREVSNEDVVNYSKDKKAVFMETSCKDNYNIDEVFFRLIKMILKAQGMLIPGCEDPDISYMDRKSVPVNKENLRSVLVPRKKDMDLVRTSSKNNTTQSSCC